MTNPDTTELRRLAAERAAAMQARIDRVLSVFTSGAEHDAREVAVYARLRHGLVCAPLRTLVRDGRLVSRQAVHANGRACVYRLAGTGRTAESRARVREGCAKGAGGIPSRTRMRPGPALGLLKRLTAEGVLIGYALVHLLRGCP